MLTRCIYMTKAERSVSKQGHLQPRCHAKGQVTEQRTVKWSIAVETLTIAIRQNPDIKGILLLEKRKQKSCNMPMIRLQH